MNLFSRPALIYRAFKSARRRMRNQGRHVEAQISFRREFREFKQISAHSQRFSMRWDERFPCLSDKTEFTGFEPHYVYHPAWATRVLARTKPAKHVDISSALRFVAMLSAFMPVDFYDYRPAKLFLSDLTCKQADLLALPFADNSIESLSCMHTVEHVGLGRYGDPLDPDGDLKAMTELQRVLAPGGSLLFVVPIGRPIIQFNAHRIYSYEQIMDAFSSLTLSDFSLVPDDYEKSGLIENAPASLADAQVWGCGCFWFQKQI